MYKRHRALDRLMLLHQAQETFDLPFGRTPQPPMILNITIITIIIIIIDIIINIIIVKPAPVHLGYIGI